MNSREDRQTSVNSRNHETANRDDGSAERNTPNGPTHIAYHVREAGTDREGKKQSYFNQIGSAFAHRDGEGFNIQLDAIPVDGRVTLRTPQQRLKQARENNRAEAPERTDRDGGYER